jgi:serine/threonine protein kinase
MESWSGKDITPEIWEKVRALFDVALEQEAGQREAFLARNCPDESVREQVRRLLADHDKAGDFLVDPAVGCLAPSAVLSHQPALSPGAILAGRFKVIRFIAEGGMGEVYEAEDLELHEHLAVKILRREVLQQTDSLARFKREVHLARKVTHPNVCRIFDLFRGKTEGNEDIVFVNMEFLRGETLAERLRRQGRLSMAEALPLVTQMASALGAAHVAGIVHGDFKPGNVMLVSGPDGIRAVVTDFGLALRAIKAATDHSLTTASWASAETGESRHLYGTPAYMAPEQMEGQPASTASDVYSLGLVIYEMVTGVRPLSGETPISTAVKRLTEPPPSPREFEPNVSLVCESVILKCLEREPAKRFARANDVAKALNEYVRGKDSGGASPPTPAAVPKPSTYPNLRLEVAYVLFLDIVAYSLQHMDLQPQLLNDLQEAVRNSPAFARAHTDDQLIRLPTGDGMALVFFGDPEAPVRCALDVARILHHRPNIKLRMGIHTGPVYRIADINANQNVAGGGINIAQRVMDHGDAGHILVSSAEAELLGQVSAWGRMLHDLGEVEVKRGVRVHLYNLYTDEAGNRELPQKLRTAQTTAATARSHSKRKRLSLGAVVMGVIAALGVAGFVYYRHAGRPSKLTDKDTIVLADFTNTTGDPIFDGTLRRGLSVQLEQSPFLSLVSDEQVQRTLRLMGKTADTPLTSEVAREICERIASAAVLDGWIAQIGSQYNLILKAVNCSTGESLVSTEVQASDKNHVLNGLGKAATEMRINLGESLSTVQKFDTPLEQATTPSLEALQAYSMGIKKFWGAGEHAAALPFFQRAISLDPNFAMAYAALGTIYNVLGETSLSIANTKKAYALRGSVSEQEKFYIESHYYDYVTEDLQKSRQVYEFWAQTYPRAGTPRGNVAIIYRALGQYEKSLVAFRDDLRVEKDAISYFNVMNAYLALGRLQEARETFDQAEAKKVDSPWLRVYRYQLAFLENDALGMKQQVAWSTEKPGIEDMFLNLEAATATYFGHIQNARESVRKAVDSAEQSEQKETAATHEADAALREALVGNRAEARQRAIASMRLARGPNVQYQAGLAMALAGDTVGAEHLANGLRREYPEHMRTQFERVRTLQALVSLGRHDVAKAVAILQSAPPFEAGDFFPVYVQGQSYIAAHLGTEAASEFKKILDHSGVLGNDPLHALSHLGLARAYVLSGDTVKAKASYQDFLTLWKDADPDIPILKEAKAEYAKLQ